MKHTCEYQQVAVAYLQRTVCHGSSILVSLHLITGEYDGWRVEGQRRLFVHGEVHVRGIDGLVRYEHQILVHVDHLQCKRGDGTHIHGTRGREGSRIRLVCCPD